MTDYETRSRVGMGLEIERLTKQLAEAAKTCAKMLSEQDYEYNRKTNAIIERHARQLAECQAREKVLRDALADGISGATKEDIKQAKREALLEAAEVEIGQQPEFEKYESNPVIWKAYLLRMAKELE